MFYGRFYTNLHCLTPRQAGSATFDLGIELQHKIISMKKLQSIIRLAIILMAVSCTQAQSQTVSLDEEGSRTNSASSATSCNQPLMGPFLSPSYLPDDQRLSQYVRRIHEDKAGNLWFGTNGDGVIRHDGDSLEYFGMKEGFSGVAVRAILEDGDGKLWFGTENGLSKFDPSKPGSFTNYNMSDGLVHSDIWSLCIDKNGLIWIGTQGGVSTFDGEAFKGFKLPETKPDHTRGVTSSRMVHSIMEDSKGSMWFGTNGGAFIYDGQSLTNISTEDGLCHNVVNDILEDRQGNFWFATHHNSVCRYNGESFTHFDAEDGVKGTEVWSLFEDSKGGIWFPTEGYGVYRYDGESFTRYHYNKGLPSSAIQCIFEDSRGRIWCGGHMGAFRLDGLSFQAVSKKGPFGHGC